MTVLWVMVLLHTWKHGKPCMIFLSVLSLCQLWAINQTKLYNPSLECLVFTFTISITLPPSFSLTYPRPTITSPVSRYQTWDILIRTNMGCGETLACWKHVILGIALGLFNFISSLINIYYLYHEDHQLFASLSLFLLWFPGNILRSGEIM